MNRPRLGLLLSLTLATTAAGTGEDWGMRPKARYPAPAPTKALGGDDWAFRHWYLP